MKNKLLLFFILLNVSFKGLGFPKKDFVYTISTSQGNIIILLHEETPLHKLNFYKLTKSKFFDSITFHRVIKDFMIQGGDPNSKDNIIENDGAGGPGYTVPAEIMPNLNHIQGAVAAARLGDGQNPQRASSGSQFYIVQNANGTPFLDGAYTVFGQVIQGIDVVNKIANVPKNYQDNPMEKVIITIDVKKMRTRKIIKKYDCEKFYSK